MSPVGVVIAHDTAGQPEDAEIELAEAYAEKVAIKATSSENPWIEYRLRILEKTDQ